jgi:hypothetical protein
MVVGCDTSAVEHCGMQNSLSPCTICNEFACARKQIPQNMDANVRYYILN